MDWDSILEKRHSKYNRLHFSVSKCAAGSVFIKTSTHTHTARYEWGKQLDYWPGEPKVNERERKSKKKREPERARARTRESNTQKEREREGQENREKRVLNTCVFCWSTAELCLAMHPFK